MVDHKALFELIDVNFSHGQSAPALVDISARIEQGGALSILGANGAGKSTLLYLLAGLYFSTQGTISYCGSVVSRNALKDKIFAREFRKRVQLVFQDPDAQLFCANVRDEIAYGAYQIFEAEEAESRVDDAISLFGLTHVAEQVPFALSLGEKRRVTLACAMAMDPDVLLLDEPTANLDAATTDFTVEWLMSFCSRPGKTAIIATHELWLSRELTRYSLVLTPCHRVACHGETLAILGDHAFLKSMNLAGKRTWNQVVN